MSKTPKTISQLVEEIAQTKRDQEAEWKLLATANQQLQATTLWTIPDLVEALTYGRVHIAPGHDPALTAPTSAREALELAWELAHPVKEGQIIPAGTGLLLREEHGMLREDEALDDWEPITEPTDDIRTIDPLPDPEPDWLDAPAILAQVDECPWQTVWLPRSGGSWACTECGEHRHWNELQEVTPLYPKDDTLHDAPRRRTFSFRDDKPWGTTLGGDPA